MAWFNKILFRKYSVSPDILVHCCIVEKLPLTSPLCSRLLSTRFQLALVISCPAVPHKPWHCIGTRFVTIPITATVPQRGLPPHFPRFVVKPSLKRVLRSCLHHQCSAMGFRCSKTILLNVYRAVISAESMLESTYLKRWPEKGEFLFFLNSKSTQTLEAHVLKQ